MASEVTSVMKARWVASSDIVTERMEDAQFVEMDCCVAVGVAVVHRGQVHCHDGGADVRGGCRCSAEISSEGAKCARRRKRKLGVVIERVERKWGA